MNKIILESLRKELLERGSLDTFPNQIWKDISALNTYGSNAVEGNSLTQEEVQKVLLEHEGVKRPIHDILETVQHDVAFRRLLGRRGRAIDLVTVLELDEEVFGKTKADAGQWRMVNVMIGGAPFTPPRWERVVPLMDTLIKEYRQRDLSGEDVFTLGAWMHYSFERTHPFSDGNGRVGRLLLNLHFLKHNWPPMNILPADRKCYLDALNKADEGDLVPLTDFLMAAMAGSLLNFLWYVGTERDDLEPLIDLQQDGTYSAKYLALRAKQGELPATRVKSEWRSSRRALDLYAEQVGRK